MGESGKLRLWLLSDQILRLGLSLNELTVAAFRGPHGLAEWPILKRVAAFAKAIYSVHLRQLAARKRTDRYPPTKATVLVVRYLILRINLLPGRYLRRYELNLPNDEIPLSLSTCGLLLVAGTGFEPVTFRL